MIPRSKPTQRGGPKVHICNDGLAGHERRVAEFYGDDYDEILRERAEIQRKIDSGEIKMVSVKVADWIKEHNAKTTKKK